MLHNFDEAVEAAIESVSTKLDMEENRKRFFAIKLIEKDSKIIEQMKNAPDCSAEIKKLEDDFDDDTESIITSERYSYISSIIDKCVKKAANGQKLTISDKIDRVVTNRILALPIFVLIMWLVYYQIATIRSKAGKESFDKYIDRLEDSIIEYGTVPTAKP